MAPTTSLWPTTLNNLGSLLIAQGNYTDAEPFLQRALKIDEAEHGPDHPIVGYPLTKLARVAVAQGNIEEATARARRAVTLRDKAPRPPPRPGVSSSWPRRSGATRRAERGRAHWPRRPATHSPRRAMSRRHGSPRWSSGSNSIAENRGQKNRGRVTSRTRPIYAS